MIPLRSTNCNVSTLDTRNINPYTFLVVFPFKMGKSKKRTPWLGSLLGQEILLRALNLMMIAPLLPNNPVVWEGERQVR